MITRLSALLAVAATAAMLLSGCASHHHLARQAQQAGNSQHAKAVEKIVTNCVAADHASGKASIKTVVTCLETRGHIRTKPERRALYRCLTLAALRKMFAGKKALEAAATQCLPTTLLTPGAQASASAHAGATATPTTSPSHRTKR